MENAINNINEDIIRHIGATAGNQLHNLCVNHMSDTLHRLQEEAQDNEGATQLTVPLKLIIIHEAGKFTVQSAMELKKTVKTVFEAVAEEWNPNQPDLFDGKPKDPEELAPLPEADEAAKTPAGKDKKDKKDKAPKAENPDSTDQCEHKDPKFALRCRLEKGHEGPCEPKPCAFQHEDGKRICMAEDGHDGMHKFIDKSELNN